MLRRLLYGALYLLLLWAIGVLYWLKATLPITCEMTVFEIRQTSSEIVTERGVFCVDGDVLRGALNGRGIRNGGRYIFTYGRRRPWQRQEVFCVRLPMPTPPARDAPLFYPG